MLDLAIKYQEDLSKVWLDSKTKENNKFYNEAQWHYHKLKIDDSDYYKLQYVSLSSTGKILGYMSARIDRNSDIITSVSAIRFDSGNVFSRDLFEFLRQLANMPVRKIEWWVLRGNPAEKLYDKIIKKYGGTKIGVYKQSVKLSDGKYYDKVFYELMITKKD